METVIIILGIIIAVLIALIVSAFMRLSKEKARAAQAETLLAERDRTIDDRDRTVADLERRLDDATYYLNDAEKQLAALQARIEVTEKERTAMEKASAESFRNLANSIFQEHTDRFKASSEQRLAELLTPLRENIDGFRKLVNESFQSEAKERFSLQKELRDLIKTNESLGREAQELSRALKGDSKVQGDWGEMILESLLEKSGLKKGVHFNTQVTTNADGTRLTDAQGHALRPDVVVYFPDGRSVVVDSKVSLSAYIDYINAPVDSPEAASAAKRHIVSVRNHVAELAAKSYQDIVGDKKLDFVMMFIPNEGAYFAMMRENPNLWEEAYSKRVLITSPTHLISILKMLEQLWKQEAINRNVQKIGELSGRMIEKLVKFQEKFDGVETSLRQALSTFDEARRYLLTGRGNVYKSAADILELGAKTDKTQLINQLAEE